MRPWVSLRVEALQDIEDAQDFFAEINAQLKARFTSEVEHTIEQIRDFPEAYAKIMGDVRRILLRRFSYAVYYRFYPDSIEIIAVLHTRRDPAIWQKRV